MARKGGRKCGAGRPLSITGALFALAGVVLTGPPLLGVAAALHTGVVGDYVAWLVFGAAVLGGFVTLAVR